MITRCVLPALNAANRDPSRMRAIVESQPETCPHTDCSVGANCRERVWEMLLVMHKCRKAKGLA